MPSLISKTSFLAGCQCHKLLWKKFNDPDAFPEIDAAKQAIFNQGHAIGELAKSLYPGGVEVGEDLMESSDLFKLYATRWQIEIIFRAWKQSGQLIKALARDTNEFHLQCLMYVSGQQNRPRHFCRSSGISGSYAGIDRASGMAESCWAATHACGRRASCWSSGGSCMSFSKTHSK